MSNFGGKYFEEVIARLMKAKEAENYQMRSAFKAELREKLLEGQMIAELSEANGFDWGAFWAKWKYALGAVPTMAILTVVAINALDQKVVMKQPEQTFQTNLQMQTSNQMEVNSLENSSQAADVSVESAGIRTFPGYLVMPSEEVLKNYRRTEDGINLPMMNSNLTELKIDDPQTQLEKVSFEGTELMPPADLPTAVNGVEVPANDNNAVMNVNSNQGNFQEELSGDVLTNQNFLQENVGMESAQFLEMNAEQMTGGMGGELPEQIDQAPALDVGNTLLTESLSVEEVKEQVEKENALRQLNDQQVVFESQQMPLAQEVLSQNGEMDLINSQFNVLDEYSRPSQYKPEINLNQQLWFNNALIEGGRVYYEGEKDQLLRAFVNSEIVARAGVLSRDYYYEGQDLEPGVIKLTLWEFGQKSKIYILKEEPYGLRVVTEVDF